MCYKTKTFIFYLVQDEDLRWILVWGMWGVWNVWCEGRFG